MENQRVRDAGLSDPSSSNHHPISYQVLHGLHSPRSSFINQEGSAFDFGELEEAIMLQGAKINNAEPKASLYNTARSAATLEMLSSWPMRFHQTQTVGNSKSGVGESTNSGSALNTFSISSKAAGQVEGESPIGRNSDNQAFDSKHLQLPLQQTSEQRQTLEMASDSSKTETSHAQAQLAAKPTSEKRKTSEKVLDAKTLRRLAQNREAARKSRLRKRAYVQQLESGRIRLTQLEQDLQHARSQGLFLGGGGVVCGNISSGAAIFDMEYARWLEDDHRHIAELRTGLQANLLEGDLRVIVDDYIAHYDEIFRLKEEAANSDVFHLITGMWTTPAERFFLWMGGFRPSELIKILIGQLDPLTEQQVMGIYSLQHSSQQAEEALSQGLDQLQQSLVVAISSGTVNNGMHHMAIALGKLTNLKGFIRQADNLRQQILHHLRRILTIRQAARCFLIVGEYYNRLRALSSLWESRPRESLNNDIENSCHSSRFANGAIFTE